MEKCVKKIELANGLIVFIYDRTRRYYEDYHLVRLQLCCEVPLVESYFENAGEFCEARDLLGESVIYRRSMEKMGVPYADIEMAGNEMIDGFENHALRYFIADDFPRKLVLSELAKSRKKAVKATGSQEYGNDHA